MDTYVETCREPFWQNIFKCELDFLVSALQGSRDVLSVGCGPAIIEGGLNTHGFHITGLDISQEALKSSPDSVRTVAGRAEDMPFAEASFDAVIYVASLQFIEDYRKALQKSAATLRPSGKIIIMLLNLRSAFYKERSKNPDSYMNLIQHKDSEQIERAVAECFTVHSEYMLGVSGIEIFTSNDPDEAALYTIIGEKKG
ncbi:MAG: class I SAM-dependent methyltransferase [Syntrophales bacterium]|nr:class I SAM-dependent methyltransferase [Syntrophales bacterium]